MFFFLKRLSLLIFIRIENRTNEGKYTRERETYVGGHARARVGMPFWRFDFTIHLGWDRTTREIKDVDCYRRSRTRVQEGPGESRDVPSYPESCASPWERERERAPKTRFRGGSSRPIRPAVNLNLRLLSLNTFCCVWGGDPTAADRSSRRFRKVLMYTLTFHHWGLQSRHVLISWIILFARSFFLGRSGKERNNSSE